MIEEQVRPSNGCRPSAKRAPTSARQPDGTMLRSRPPAGWAWTNEAAGDDADETKVEAVSEDDAGGDSRATPIWLANQQATEHRN